MKNEDFEKAIEPFMHYVLHNRQLVRRPNGLVSVNGEIHMKKTIYHNLHTGKVIEESVKIINK